MAIVFFILATVSMGKSVSNYGCYSILKLTPGSQLAHRVYLNLKEMYDKLLLEFSPQQRKMGLYKFCHTTAIALLFFIVLLYVLSLTYLHISQSFLAIKLSELLINLISF